ncbi:MAG TPA: class I SAM-dependent methyltransferase [Thermoanaerobaculia bacterium]|nr:class I SAM-dependent methyltransferase [Thermoanaerobaculia bacterium]
MTTPVQRDLSSEVVPQSPTAKPGTGSRGARALARLLDGTGVPCEMVLPSGEAIRCGDGPPKFRVLVHSDRALRGAYDELALGRAYMEGEIDIEGDVWSAFEVRRLLQDRARMSQLLRFLVNLFLIAPTRINRRSIDFHYTLGDDFYHSFIDSRYHFYSQGLFHTEDESLEEASEHKLETLFAALRLAPGMRLLDIGGGWGGVTRYCAARGVHVTSLTLAQDSYNYIRNVLDTPGFAGEVHLQDFLEHRPERPYDAIVILGVIEHIPTYRRFCELVWADLAPGGRIYMDASASHEKYEVGSFTRQYIWQGSHSFLCVQDMVQEFLFHGFEVEEVKCETRDYELTMRHWAERLDAARDFIVKGWGEKVYRAFRLYLWGGTHALHANTMQAYHLVARRGEQKGPRPGFFRRAGMFLRELK